MRRLSSKSSSDCSILILFRCSTQINFYFNFKKFMTFRRRVTNKARNEYQIPKKQELPQRFSQCDVVLFFCGVGKSCRFHFWLSFFLLFASSFKLQTEKTIIILKFYQKLLASGINLDSIFYSIEIEKNASRQVIEIMHEKVSSAEYTCKLYIKTTPGNHTLPVIFIFFLTVYFDSFFFLEHKQLGQQQYNNTELPLGSLVFILVNFACFFF